MTYTEIVRQTSPVTKRLHDYITINELPSGFRSYRHREIPITKFLVRGLTYGEITSLSKIEEVDLEKLVPIYRDVIQFPEDPLFTIGELELMDFISITMLVSLYTLNDLKWDWKSVCPNCSTPISKKIGLGDLNFEVNPYQDLPLSINLKDIEGLSYELHMITVDDMIEINRYADSEVGQDDIYEVAYSLAKSKDNLEDTLTQVYNFSYNDISIIRAMIDELLPKAPYFQHQCSNPSCGVTITVDFDTTLWNIVPKMSLKNLYETKYVWLRTFNTELNTEELYSEVQSILNIHSEVLSKDKEN